MKNRRMKDEKNSDKSESISIPKKKMMMKKNMTRLGGGGLSLDAFANAKSMNNHYNPALIKKQREFYRNAKNVTKFKKLLKHQNQQNDTPSSLGPRLPNEDEVDDMKMNKKRKQKEGNLSLEELYKKKHEERERERMEREAAIKAKKEEIEKAEARRKSMREKMLKKTRTGQPVMKYRIEHILETIQGSTKISAGKKS